MKQHLVGLFSIAVSWFTLISCGVEEPPENVANVLFEKRVSDSSPNEILGYWEAQFTEAAYRQFWRIKIEEEQVTFGVRCTRGSTRLQTSGVVPSSIQDQGSRLALTFEENRDFRVARDGNICGANIREEGTVFLRVDEFILEITPDFDEIQFEKISDLEEEE